MNERGPKQLSYEEIVRKQFDLSWELYEVLDIFPFPGITPKGYEQLKNDEQDMPESYVTPVDTLLEAFTRDGMRIERGIQIKETEVPTIIRTIAPAKSDGGFYGEDLLPIKYLNITEDMDPRLVELITLLRE